MGVMSCHVLSCPVLSCHVMSCHVMRRVTQPYDFKTPPDQAIMRQVCEGGGWGGPRPLSQLLNFLIKSCRPSIVQQSPSLVQKAKEVIQNKVPIFDLQPLLHLHAL